MSQIESLPHIDPIPTKPKREPKPKSHQSEFGQFMTPPPVSAFMAGMFDQPSGDVLLLDAGAGQASLTTSFVERWRSSVDRLETHAYEVDASMLERLHPAMAALASSGVTTEVFEGDFLERAAHMIRLARGPRYTHAILNPPYGKIGVSSTHRKWARAAGLETVNLYSAFVGLALQLMRPGGEIVAIIPRSFCNGPYYLPFRRLLLEKSAIRRIHLFGARNKAFKEDAVLQENVIVHLVVGAQQKDVVVSTSTDRTFGDLTEVAHPFDEIVFPEDEQIFIHVPDGEGGGPLAHTARLEEIGLKVSTGPVVDFRVREHVRADPEPGDAPLLYPGHFVKGETVWPRANFKKPNAIARNAKTEKWLYPAGFYVIVKRFSAKEEKRRVVAYVVDPDDLDGYGGAIGFENHWNVFHAGRKPLDEITARGLATYLNGSAFDAAFRRFNGHTQVNATDLRNMTYPGAAVLSRLGHWQAEHPDASQDDIDQIIEENA
jgi:adenine-specific DNA-methyltransferase